MSLPIQQVGLTLAIKRHFEERKRIWPTTEDGLLFIQTELAEASELVLSLNKYKRNHPESKEYFSEDRFAEELGDIIYMCIITGLTKDCDPIDALLKKMDSQLESLELSPKKKSASQPTPPLTSLEY